MLRDRIFPNISEFLKYLAAHPEAENNLPPLAELSRELGVGVAVRRGRHGRVATVGADTEGGE